MGVRYKAIAKSSHGSKEYTVDLHDSLWVSDYNEIDLYAPGFQIKYLGDEGNIIAPVIASDITIYYKIDNASDFNFFSNVLNLAQEDRFYIEVKEGSTVIWRGVVQQDEVQWEDAAYPLEFKVKAVDGLALLKTVKKKFTTNLGGNFLTLAGYLVDAFNEISWVGEFLTSTDVVLRTCVHWEEDQMIATDDMMNTTFHIQTGLSFVESENGRIDYYDWFSVVEQICEAVGARLMMVNGIYYLFQPYAGLKTQPVTVYEYQVNYSRRPTLLVIPAAGGSSTTETITTTLPETTSGLFGLTPALRRATVYRDITLGYLLMYKKNIDITSTWQTVGPVYDNSNVNQIRLQYTQNIEVENTSFACSFQVELKGEIRLVVGATTYYATPTGWSTTLTTLVMGTYTLYSPFVSVVSNEVYRLKVDFTTFALPGTGTLSIQLRAAFKGSTTPSGASLTFVRNYSERLAVTYANFIDNQNVRSEILNTTNAYSSVEWEKESFYLGDDPSSFIDGPGFYTYPTGSAVGVNPGGLVMSTSWSDTYFTSQAINYAMVLQRMRLSVVPHYKWQGTVYDRIDFHKIYSYQGKNYMLLSATFTAHDLATSVVMAQLASTASGFEEVSDPSNNLPTT